ncbi:MAG: NUDIX hydrolase [Chlamydiales bacterium]|nr:NUDIX hydrolase [Chlamydiales bacterium]
MSRMIFKTNPSSKSFCILTIFCFAIIILTKSFSGNLLANEQSITRYLELYEQYPEAFGPKGDWKKNEMELIDDLQVMRAIQKQFNQPVGIVAEDRFWLWIRDALILPSGEHTTYNRFLSKKGLDGPAGVVVLAVTPNNEILVNLIYRHATRSWEIELPRGGRNKGETSEAAARREVKEETGYKVTKILPLGTIAVDSGVFTNYLKAFFAKIGEVEETTRDDEEIIASNLLLSKDHVIDIFCAGKTELIVNKQKITAYVRDPFFAYALLLAEKKGFLES